MATHFFGIRDRVYSYRDCIGRGAISGDGFICPVDLALASNDVAYVVNRSFEYRPDGLRVTKCTLGGDYIGEFGSAGNGEGQFIWPTAIALDSDENVYVADEWLNRVIIFDKDGKFLRSWGKAGSGDGELNGPAGLAVTAGNDLFVVDSRNNRVQKFTADGRYLGQCGSAGNGPGQFNLPWGIDLDKEGNVYVADWRNDRIQKFTAEGKWLASCGSSGSGPGQFSRPSGVCVDNDGDIYVADWQNDRVQVLTPEGRFITAITGNAGLSKWGIKSLQANSDMIRQRALALVNDGGAWEREFSRPTAVRADDHNHIAILDMGRYRIQLYEKSRNATLN
jgi:DNA-binding beta-propeller fold protein YncE